MSTRPIGYAEQEDAVRALSRHYTGGRLDVDAFDDRVRRARAATTVADLAPLFGDLPEPHPDALRDTGGASGASTDGTPTDTGSPDRAGDGDTGTGGAEATARIRPPDPTLSAPAEPDPSGHPAAGPYPDSSPTTGQPHPGSPWSAYDDSPAHGGDAYGAPGGPAGPAGAGYGGPGYGAPGYGPPGPDTPGYGAGYGAGYEGGWGAAGYQPGYGLGQTPGAPGWAPGPGGPAYPPHAGPPAYGPYGYDPAAPFGREAWSGRPYSDKQKIVAGLLQLFLPFGIGRFYSGHTGLAIAQLLVMIFTFGLGAIWSFIDGIVILAGSPTDPDGRPLRP
ncbi:hypothetical protein Ae168Ps1_0012c [Pseudonocardia sp. Ae168_Ps1]|uniref:DUF1707 domain-containing protein n=1 Tax=unclassified Pseudonocardia TaxID=2619320 RepID=UPI00094B2B25|nr:MULTISPECIES: DUF1707 domain-containing protein [unclassified Pseudonocardia]OLL71634.1 hypothetical protein Ae150APs1_0012c [Pseudonocardia sp. Ae150A_Ps1]OLL77606.1 hypothetical protein Ae168Ps1_0012c [Pseudonocardia sp. Ae168_Ps1]OLL88276.1 hypothetical protein Ae263Ps1_5331 [Pseudonocardia sp. Ae263_Ps1]OLL91699.1 hypothetical protein Ae356Ps1_1596c [Pseudonocardia sp. Ae356_Ps1]